MDHKAIVKLCRDLGCCDACCLRYIGLRNPAAYENCHEYILKYLEDQKLEPDKREDGSTNQEQPDTSSANSEAPSSSANGDAASSVVAANGMADEEDPTPSLNGHEDLPPAKRRRHVVCHSCLGVLQTHTWPQSLKLAKDTFDAKNYESSTFAAALSSPLAALLRERAIALIIAHDFPGYEIDTCVPLKEAWKWCFGSQLAAGVGQTLDSGAIAPLMVTINMEYSEDLQELEILKRLSPSLCSRPSHRLTSAPVTRRAAEQALGDVTRDTLTSVGWVPVPTPQGVVHCASAVWVRLPMYLGGRYTKHSRSLPQTPWLVGADQEWKNPHGSVQDVIFGALAKVLGLLQEESEHRLKMITAGREDVDVRCLGDGRPFAVEITDTRRRLTPAELQSACDVISSSKDVTVKTLVYVDREQLMQLKKGEETKCKTYEALCVKLGHGEADLGAGDGPVTVTPSDLSTLNSYRNTPPSHPARMLLQQKTPLRVLHRRPLLTRERSVIDFTAYAVPGHPSLFVLRAKTAAGTYVKEWVHGELGRSRPSLASILGAPLDILALDVAGVELEWPPNQ